MKVLHRDENGAIRFVPSKGADEVILVLGLGQHVWTSLLDCHASHLLLGEFGYGLKFPVIVDGRRNARSRACHLLPDFLDGANLARTRARDTFVEPYLAGRASPQALCPLPPLFCPGPPLACGRVRDVDCLDGMVGDNGGFKLRILHEIWGTLLHTITLLLKIAVNDLRFGWRDRVHTPRRPGYRTACLTGC